MSSMARWWRSRSGGSRLATQGCSSTCWRGMRVSSGIRRGTNAGSCEASMMRVSFMAAAGHFDGGLGAFVKGAIDDVGPFDQLSDRGGVETELCGGDVGEEAGAGDVVGIVKAMAGVAAIGDPA